MAELLEDHNNNSGEWNVTGTYKVRYGEIHPKDVTKQHQNTRTNGNEFQRVGKD